MIRSNINKLSKWDSFCVLPGHENDINKALIKGCKKIIVQDDKNKLPYIKVKNTRSFLNNYLKQYDNLLKNIKIIGVMDNNAAYILYSILNSIEMKAAYIGRKGYYKDEKIQDIYNLEVDDLYEMLLDSYHSYYKYAIIELDDYLIENDVLANIKFDIILVNKIYNNDIKYVDFSMRLLFEKISKNGSIIINGDNAYIGYMGYKKMITYGFTDNDYKIVKYILTKNKTMFKYLHNNKYYNIKTDLFGIDNIYMTLSLIITLSKLKISDRVINEVFSKISIPYNYEVIPYKDNYIMLHKLDINNDIKDFMKNIKLYNYNRIFIITNSNDESIINMLMEYTKYIIISNDKDKINIIMKKILKKVENNDLVLFLETEENIKTESYA